MSETQINFQMTIRSTSATSVNNVNQYCERNASTFKKTGDRQWLLTKHNPTEYLPAGIDIDKPLDDGFCAKAVGELFEMPFMSAHIKEIRSLCDSPKDVIIEIIDSDGQPIETHAMRLMEVAGVRARESFLIDQKLKLEQKINAGCDTYVRAEYNRHISNINLELRAISHYLDSKGTS